MKKIQEDWQRTVDFHGHACPGLAQGFRASQAALNALKIDRSEDEELVAIVENDACGVDAVQVLTGCTLGKGNLILHNYGKQVFTFARRDQALAIRIYVHGGAVKNAPVDSDEGEKTLQSKKDRIQQLLSLPDEEILIIQQIKLTVPEKARIFNSINCHICNEKVGEIYARVRYGKPVCIPCADSYSRGW